VEWAHVPAGTAELALICEDPDAPSGTFVHWVLAGISPDSTEIVEDQVPETAVVGRNGFGELGWGGPQPPIGDEPHRYFFHLYAVDRPLGLRQGEARSVSASVSRSISCPQRPTNVSP
jgi:Raf kinase inhibitor-like YbhB/YbcL family protein